MPNAAGLLLIRAGNGAGVVRFMSARPSQHNGHTAPAGALQCSQRRITRLVPARIHGTPMRSYPQSQLIIARRWIAQGLCHRGQGDLVLCVLDESGLAARAPSDSSCCAISSRGSRMPLALGEAGSLWLALASVPDHRRDAESAIRWPVFC
jgi:hypothetical protein